MKPFFAFLAFEASSIRLRTSARLRSISACLAFLAYTIGGNKGEQLECVKMSHKLGVSVCV